MSQATTLAPKENAAFAVLSRLISCLVTEQILLAFYTSTRELGKNSGVLVVLSPGISSHPDRSIAADDVFALVLMKQPPVFLNQSSTRYGKRVGLLDPLDMLPGVYGFAANGTDGSNIFCDTSRIQDSTSMDICSKKWGTLAPCGLN